MNPTELEATAPGPEHSVDPAAAPSIDNTQSGTTTLPTSDLPDPKSAPGSEDNGELVINSQNPNPTDESDNFLPDPKQLTCNFSFSANKFFSVLYFNCRSLLPKIDELAALCAANKPDVVCLVETWLSADVVNSEVAIHNYSLIRLDRNRHGGGVAIYVHNCVLYNIVLSGPAELELIIVSLCKSGFKLCLGVFYRPPSSQSSIFDSLCETLFTVDQVYLYY